MVHGDDADEEDLDEAEVKFAMANFVEGRNEQTAEETEYAAKFAAQQATEDMESDPEPEVSLERNAISLVVQCNLMAFCCKGVAKMLVG